jgi:hypothetical protein
MFQEWARRARTVAFPAAPHAPTARSERIAYDRADDGPATGARRHRG